MSDPVSCSSASFLSDLLDATYSFLGVRNAALQINATISKTHKVSIHASSNVGNTLISLDIMPRIDHSAKKYDATEVANDSTFSSLIIKTRNNNPAAPSTIAES